MATANQLRALLKSYAEADSERFYSVAMQLAAHEARLGHGKLARELRGLIDEARTKRSAAKQRSSPVPLAAPRGDLAGLLSVSYPDVRLEDMILPPTVERKLRRLLREQRQQAKLLTHALPPRAKVLLVGPPGSGKTMSTRALAGELRLPLFTILLDGLITKFMGETAAKLRLVFDAIRETRGIYLFDEFDAIGGQRTLMNDVGEIRRVLNSFLHFLEEAEPTSVIVAATNHPDLLDPALFRRFDDVIEYSLPTDELACKTFRTRLQGLETGDVDWQRVVAASEGLSYADIVKACEDAAKEAILGDTETVTTETLLRALKDRCVVRRPSELSPGRRPISDYPINVFWSDEDDCYVAHVPDLKYCSAFEDTPEEALAEVEKAKEASLATARDRGRTPPSPAIGRQSTAR